MARRAEVSAWSLRRRLVGTVVVAAAVVFTATAAYVYVYARHEIDGLLDAHLAQSASLIVAQVGHDLEEIEVEHAPELHARMRRVAFQIWEGGTVLRLHSARAPAARLSRKEEGFDDTQVDGRAWRVFSTWDDAHRNLVQVGERADARREIVLATALGLVAALMVAVPVLAAIAWLGIGRVLAPLQALGDTVGRRPADDLSPLRADGAPREVLPLVTGLNDLFARVARLIDGERRFTADAAHELRTPLAAVRTQAEVARAARDDAERAHALDQVIVATERATRLTEQLLTLARLEPEVEGARARRVDLRAIAQAVAADMAPAALAHGVEVEVADGGDVIVDGDADLLTVLLRNLVDNAVRYGGSGNAVRIDFPLDGTPAVAVTDRGPGLAPDEREKVGQRFYRVPGTTAPGSGLGLSIVQRIAALHRARLIVEPGDEGRGLRVLVRFPAPRNGG